MTLLKQLSINIAALALAAAFGFLATGAIAYGAEAHVGAVRVAPLVRGASVSILVAAIAPRTRFLPRLAAFCGIYVLDLAISVALSNLALWMVNRFWAGNPAAAYPRTHTAVLIPFVAALAGVLTLRRYRIASR